MPNPDRNDRVRGRLLGPAVGAAVGAAVEFASPGTFEPVDDMIVDGPHGPQPG